MSDSSAIAHGGVQAAEHGHSPHLHHQFESVKQQADAGNLAMWLFILTEVMFFGGLFTVYMVYRNWYYRAFVAASHQLDWKLGAINSVLLITSSFTMALAVRSAQLRRKSALIMFLIVTFVLGFVFLGIKGTEYKEKWEKHHIPGSHYSLQSFLHPSTDPVAKAAGDKQLPLDIARKTEVYFSLYFAMTGLHALHMLIGMGIILFMIFRARSDAYTTGNAAYVEYFGLYWHFVDIIWIFLFPLLYLINRH